MGIFLHKLPYKKNKHFLTVAISPNDNFPIHPWFMHCIVAKITLLTGKGNEWEAFTFYKALAVTIWQYGNALQKEIFSFKKPVRNSLLLFGEFAFKILVLLSKLEKRIYISRSLLKSGEPFSKFLFLFSKFEIFLNISFSSRNLRKENSFLFLFSKVENPFSKFIFLFSKLGKGISGFSFSSRNWRK